MLRCCDGGRLPALQFAFRSVRAHCIHEVRTMITRVAIPLLLLPLLVLTLPLMFALAWLQETIGDMAPPSRPSNEA
jgi:hypothetical protein